MTTFEDGDAVLAHFGVKGMKWGHRKSKTGSNGQPLPSRRELRGMNKVARKEDKARFNAQYEAKVKRHDDSIMRARKELPDKYAAYNAAKGEYKAKKREIGKVAARRVLEQPLKDMNNTYLKAGQLTTAELKKKRNQDLTKLGLSLVRGALV